jgi:hypothetical protein
MHRRAALILVAVSGGLYGVSLFLPAFACVHKKSFPGYTVLAIGWASAIALDPRWFGNVGFAVLVVATVANTARQWRLVTYATGALAVASLLPAPGCEGAGAPNLSGPSVGRLSLGWCTATYLRCTRRTA